MTFRHVWSTSLVECQFRYQATLRRTPGERYPAGVAAHPRPTARVLLIAPGDRILLFRWIDPETGRVVWFTPGGGLHLGESYADAARRELREEVGIDPVEIGPCVWIRRHVLPRTLTPSLDLRERFFVARGWRYCDRYDGIHTRGGGGDF
jgi:8-oxo-dGTP pyrophosphatase MutT (NUDIX family)